MANADTITADQQVARIFEWRRGFNTIHLIDVGVRLGLFKALAESPGATAEEVAARLSLHAPYVSVWCKTAYGMELLDGETGLLADPRVLAPLVRRARAPCHPEDDQLAEPRVERRLPHEDLVEGHPRLAEREVMGQEAEHLRHGQRVGARQVELRPTEVRGEHGSRRVVPLLDRERGQRSHNTDPPFTPRTWPVM